MVELIVLALDGMNKIAVDSMGLVVVLQRPPSVSLKVGCVMAYPIVQMVGMKPP